MLTGLKFSSLACKCVNFTEKNIIQKGGGTPWNSILKVLKCRNTQTDRAQRVDGKNGVICLVIMFTSRVMVIKMSKMTHSLYFLLMPAKNQSQFG